MRKAPGLIRQYKNSQSVKKAEMTGDDLSLVKKTEMTGDDPDVKNACIKNFAIDLRCNWRGCFDVHMIDKMMRNEILIKMSTIFDQ